MLRQNLLIVIPLLLGITIVFIFGLPFYYNYLLLGIGILALSFTLGTDRKALKTWQIIIGSLLFLLGVLYIIT